MKKYIILFFLLTFSLPTIADDKESAYDRVLRTGVIRCGYIVYPKQIEIDPNTGTMSGIAYDITEAAAKELGFKIEWSEEVGTGTFVEGLKNQRFDLLCNTAYDSAARARYISSSIPLFHTPVFALARTNDTRFSDDLSAINNPDVKIGTVDGSQYTIIAQQTFPKAQLVSFVDMTDFSQLLLETQTGKTDIGLADLAITKKYMEANPGKLKIIGTKPVRFYSNVFLYRRGDEKFGGMFDTALRNLHNFGIVEKILEKYENNTKIYYRIAPLYQKPE